MSSNALLVAWLIIDLVWTVLVFAVCSYLVFWKEHSGWWYLLALFLGSVMGGDKLFKRLYERTAPNESVKD